MKKAEGKSVILNDEQFVYLRYYEKLTTTPIEEVVREIIEDWLDVSYPVDVGRIERERGLPSTLVVEVPA